MFWIILVVLIILYFSNKGIPSVLYHQINDLSSVNENLFESHIKYLSENSYKGITISDYVNKDYNKHEKNIMITFDDGYYDNYKIVFPILKKYNMKATIFLNTMYLEDRERIEQTEILNNREANYEAMKKYVEVGDGKTWQYMTWCEIKEMYESGLLDFQAHTHKHTPVISDINSYEIIEKEEKDSSNLYILGRKSKIGDIIFRKRGETSIKGFIVKREFYDEFNKFYLENKDKTDRDKLVKEFINENKEKFIKEEKEEEAIERIKKDVTENKELIEKNLGNKVIAFCWPWGHRSKFGEEILKNVGYESFVTTKKGTNSIWGNPLKIRRIELRKFTLNKFILNVKVNRNLILGKIYELIS